MRYSEIKDRRVRAGVIGIALAAAVVLASLQYARLPFFAGNVYYTAEFEDAGGLMSGDDVEVSGVKVGRVDSITLDGDHVQVRFVLPPSVRLGGQTSAAIKTLTILGRKSLAIKPTGAGELHAHGDIPLARTTSPYSLTDALGDLTTTVKALDTDQLNKALNTLSDTLSDTPAPLRAAMDGVAALSRSLNARDQSLQDLLAKAGSVSTVLADRSTQINSMLVDGDSLLGELDARRTAITELITNIGAVSQQLSGLVADNQQQLQPALTQLNQVATMLEKNKDNLTQSIDLLPGFEGALSEQVGTGPYFQAIVQGGFGVEIQPLVDAMVQPDRLSTDLPPLLNDRISPPPPELVPGYTNQPGAHR